MDTVGLNLDLLKAENNKLKAKIVLLESEVTYLLLEKELEKSKHKVVIK